ncbi:SDR family oxidoreductase [Fictibacillus iocasae]|uniref:SDR family oxidoreductase n=1 Tax=Fictibacillus iocasae TaxID=2715437 RepID=A0ABW2NMI6_9BACL
MNNKRTVLITGAANGIGKGIASYFLKRGWNAVLTDIDHQALAKVRTEFKISHPEAEITAKAADVSDPEAVKALFASVGQLDALVNNAGKMIYKSLFELDVEEWDTVLNTNLRGVFLCSREGAKIMKKQENGVIINIASTRASMSEPDTEAYAASKGGIVALTHALAVSLSPFHIRVNCISPGWIETGDYSSLREVDHDQHLSNRVGVPEDIARACYFLADTQNDFINGHNMVIDGGMTKKMIYEH